MGHESHQPHYHQSPASRIIDVIDSRIKRFVRSTARVDATWGTVSAVASDGKSASAYLYGETNGAYQSQGFSLPEASYVSVGNVVKVAMDYGTGERWIDKVHVPSAYKKVAFDLVSGRIWFGSGTTAMTTSAYYDTSEVAGGVLRIADSADQIARVILDGELNIRNTSTTALGITGDQTVVSNFPFLIKAGSSVGDIEWGPGAASRDLRLRRTGAGQMYLDSNTAAAGTNLFIQSTSGQTSRLSVQVSGDTNPRLQLRGDATDVGALWFGPGNASLDTNLYRHDANVLTTDDALRINGPFLRKGTLSRELQYDADGAATASRFTISATTGEEASIRLLDAGDAQPRVTLSMGSGLQFGSGAAGLDTNLYRSAANVLKTDDDFVVGGGQITLSTDTILVRTAAYQIRNDGSASAASVLFDSQAHSSVANLVGYTARYSGDTTARMFVGSTTSGVGSLEFGPGNASRDTNLYRLAANELATDDTFVVGGRLRKDGIISPTQLVANTDNWNPTGLATSGVIRINVDAARNITGIVAGTDGDFLLLVNANTGGFTITLVHDATSTAANRFYCPGAANYSLTNRSSVWIWYDGTSSRWRVIA